MLSEERHSARSPSESAQTGSVHTEPKTRLTGRLSHHSSSSEEDVKKNVPSAPPLSSAFRTTKKSSSTSTNSTPVQSTPKPTSNSTKTQKTSNGTSVQRPTFRRVSADEQVKYGQRTPNKTTTPSESKRTTPGTYTRVSARDIENEKPSIFAKLFSQAKKNPSVFEKINQHDGHTTYLGTGTFPQLEDCIRNCFECDRSHTDITHHTTKYDFPHKCLTRASILEDYSYDGILSPRCHITCSCSSPYHFDHHKRSAAELSLNEIREVNDALAKYGIPVFSHHDHHYNPYHKPPVGDIISTCRHLLEDPLLRSHSEGTHAVQHVWDNIHSHLPPSPPPTNIHGYASPAVRGVASHLFHPSQTPYDPVHGVASHLFGQPQQTPYNPAQGPSSQFYGQPQQSPYNPAQGPPSQFFGQPQQSPYNPAQGPPSQFFGQPQQGPSSSGQSVLSRLFGRPQ